jgi:hypothetical protein
MKKKEMLMLEILDFLKKKKMVIGNLTLMITVMMKINSKALRSKLPKQLRMM